MTTRSTSLSRGINWASVLHILLFVCGSAAIVGAFAFDEVRVAVTAIVFCILFAVGQIDVRLSILGLFAFLTLLGDVRRLLIPFVGWSGTDPILMVAPVFAVLLLGFTLISQRVSLHSGLSKCMLLLTGIMILQVFNPKQGGLMVGVTGAILMIVPTFWFWIGQAFASRSLLKTLCWYVIVPLSVLAMAMGLVQILYGYLPYQLEWYRIAGYTALGNSEETLRPISIFANITEYLSYVSIAIVILFAALLHEDATSKIKQLAVLLIPCGLASLLLGGSRGPVVMSVLVIVLMWAIQGPTIRSWIPRLAVAGLLGTMGFVWSMNQASELSGSSRIQANLERQSEIMNDGGTVAIHADLAWSGVRFGIVKEPFGLGIGATTRAAKKFGGKGFNSEKDVTNMFISTGLIGGTVYLIFVVWVAVIATKYWIRTRSIMALTLFGVLAFTGLSWLKPGHYVTTPLAWLLIGALDSLEVSSRRHTESSDLSTHTPR